MFTITSTRVVGLIAVCAVIVAPHALAASSTHSRIAPPGDEPSGFNLGEPKNGRAVFSAARWRVGKRCYKEFGVPAAFSFGRAL